MSGSVTHKFSFLDQGVLRHAFIFLVRLHKDEIHF